MGNGSIDLFFVPYFGRWNLDAIWDHPPIERYLRRLASFSRLIVLNPRGTGVSDPVSSNTSATPEEMSMDIRSVLDAVGSERAAVFTHEASTPTTMFFAAAFPERIHSLAILNGFAFLQRDHDCPWGFPKRAFASFTKALTENWGSGRNLDYMAPDIAIDERERDWFARLERLTLSYAFNERQNFALWDARSVVPLIKAPTLVIAHDEVPFVRVEHGRYLAEKIPGARYIERRGPWGVFWAQDVDWTLGEIEAFFTGTRGATALDDRVLATVLYTDIVGSTEVAARLGDARWRELLDEHDALVRRELERFRGRYVSSAGDGVLATFDGPARAVRCASELHVELKKIGIDIRAGAHTGEVEVRGNDIGGIAVHIGARVSSMAGAGETFVSSTVKDLVVGSGIDFEDRGTHDLKGVPDVWRIYAVA